MWSVGAEVLYGICLSADAFFLRYNRYRSRPFDRYCTTVGIDRDNVSGAVFDLISNRIIIRTAFYRRIYADVCIGSENR